MEDPDGQDADPTVQSASSRPVIPSSLVKRPWMDSDYAFVGEVALEFELSHGAATAELRIGDELVVIPRTSQFQPTGSTKVTLDDPDCQVVATRTRSQIPPSSNPTPSTPIAATPTPTPTPSPSSFIPSPTPSPTPSPIPSPTSSPTPNPKPAPDANLIAPQTLQTPVPISTQAPNADQARPPSPTATIPVTPSLLLPPPAPFPGFPPPVPPPTLEEWFQCVPIMIMFLSRVIGSFLTDKSDPPTETCERPSNVPVVPLCENYFFSPIQTTFDREKENTPPDIKIFVGLYLGCVELQKTSPNRVLKCLATEAGRLGNHFGVVSRQLKQALEERDGPKILVWQAKFWEIQKSQMVAKKLIKIIQNALDFVKPNFRASNSAIPRHIVDVYARDSKTGLFQIHIGTLGPVVSIWLGPLLSSKRCQFICSLSDQANARFRVYVRTCLPLSEPERHGLRNLKRLVPNLRDEDPIGKLLHQADQYMGVTIPKPQTEYPSFAHHTFVSEAGSQDFPTAPSSPLLPKKRKRGVPSEGHLFHPTRVRTVLQSQSFVNSEDSKKVNNNDSSQPFIRPTEQASVSTSKDVVVSPHLKIQLKAFQKDALAWMLRRERGGSDPAEDCSSLTSDWEKRSDEGRTYYVNTKTQERIFPNNRSIPSNGCFGGILADEMGMGKTIQMLALILTNTKFLWEEKSKPQNATTKENAQKSEENDLVVMESYSSVPVRSTLIVCPLSVLLQWKQEILKHASPKVTVYVFHGSNRRKDSQYLASIDIVLTTYSTLAADVFPGEASEGDRQKKKRKISPRSEPSRSLSSSLDSSTDEGEKSDSNLQQVNRVIRSLNKRKEEMLAQHQGIPATGALPELQEIESHLQEVSESKRSFSQRLPANQSSCLAKVNWLRVVLDEAHIIKERTTKTAKAVFLLNAQKRWCMTGTPIQNKVEDLYSLVRFLQVPQYQEPQYWSRTIARPLKHNDCRARERLQNLLSDILLRRTKCQKEQEGLAALVPLPAKVIRLRTDAFRSDEQDFYNALENESRVEFDSYVAKGTVLQNYASILQLILRLRQACGHPHLVVEGRRRSAASENRILNPLRVCCACDDEMEHYWGSQSCSHLVCQQCLQYYQRSQDPITEDSQVMFSCPLCSQSDDKGEMWKKIPPPVQPVLAEQLVSGQPWRPSTKICALLQELHRMWKDDPEEKAIVFSQWTSMLDHVQKALENQNIRYSRLDGSMTSVARDRSQGQFTNDPKTNVFLISLKAGGQGLNLVCASRVFLLDPWWNPATEAQAIDRVHRMGQKRPVFVTRFVIQGTIEERILKLQQKKSEIAQSTIDGANRSKKRDQALRFQELQLLLNS